MEKHFYSARPEIITQLVRLLHNDSEADLCLKTIVLKTLRVLARNSVSTGRQRSEFSRFHQILKSLGSNLNHGILLTLYRENVAMMQSREITLDEMYYTQALHRLVREFLETPQGASNLGFAGIVPSMVDVLRVNKKSSWNIVAALADTFANLFGRSRDRHNDLVPLFVNADGLPVVIRAIKVFTFVSSD